MLNESDRHFKNLVSATQILKKLAMRGYTGKYTAQAVHMLLEKYGIKPKTHRNGVNFYNKKNAINCIEMHIYELFQTCEELKSRDEETAYYDDKQEVGYSRDDMSTASRELLANDGVFGADENELYKTEGMVFENKNALTILWLDDQRDPYRYLHTKSKSNTFLRNKQFYDNLMGQYDVNFIWVKNFYQFKDYIKKNGIPQFVSFDHDLNNREGGEGLSDEQKSNNNGVNCAKWLVSYCRENGQRLPKFYVHSANPKHGPEINKVLSNEGKTEFMKRKKLIRLTESQFIRLVENNEDEGFSMKFSSPNVPYEVKFEPNKKGGYSDTSIFKEGTKEFNVRIQELPKSGLKSINLYFIKNMNINKAVKHGTNINGQAVNIGSEEARNSIEYFKKRSAYYVTRILSKMGVSPDLFTCPESSSNFNKQMLNLMSSYYPNGNVMLMPDVMEKNVNNVTMDIQKAKELGLTDEEIAVYQGKISKMKDDEKIREYRREIEALKANIEKLLTHKRGRPSKDVTNMRGEIDAYNNLIRLKRGRGRDSTVDANGNIKSFQIKSLDDKQRRILDGLFTFNTRKYPSRVYNKNGTTYEYPQYMKLSGKIVVVFDDNISSGATLDMLCNEMKKYNPKMIIPITLGQIPLTSYDLSMRGEINKGRA